MPRRARVYIPGLPYHIVQRGNNREACRWSSYGFNACGDAGWLRRHERYMSLGMSREERCHAYRELFRAHLDGQDIHLIRQAAHYCQPVGDDRFRQQIEQRYDIRLGQIRRGRSRKVR